MFETRELANTPPYKAKLRAPHCLFIILIFIIYIIFLNTLVATLFYSSSSYVSSSFMELHIFTYQWICTQFVVVHVDLKNGSKMKCHFFFLSPPPISLWDHPKSQNRLFIQLGTGGLMSWGPFVSTCRHLALQIWRKKLALRTNSYQHVISQQHLGHNFWWVFSPR